MHKFVFTNLTNIIKKSFCLFTFKTKYVNSIDNFLAVRRSNYNRLRVAIDSYFVCLGINCVYGVTFSV